MSDAVRTRLGRAFDGAALGEHALEDGARVPRVAPDDEAGVVELVRLAAAERWSVLPLGLGSKLGWLAPPARVDVALSTARLAGVVAYEPGDGTVAARAGTTMAALADAVAAGGHALSPLVPRPVEATLGGVVAAGQSGLDRLRLGPVRHHVLGARAVLADGSTAKSGGRLVKNVTGYDLHRLWCGAHGTLGVLVEVALRLAPRPDALVVLVAGGLDRGEALARARALRALPLRPLALLVREAGGACELVLALAGGPEVVAHERELAAAALPGAERLEDDAASARLARERDAPRADGGWPHVELACLPSALPSALDGLARAARDLGLDPELVAHPGVALATLRDPALDDPDAAAALHGALERLPGRARWLRAPLALRRAVDPTGPPSPGLGTMRRLKDALDPAGLFAAGRAHGRL